MIARAERKHTLFVIEKLPAEASPLSKLLEREGFDVFHYVSPRESLRKIAELAPDMVLLDISDESMQWLELCEEIKRLTVDKGIYTPVVLLASPEQMRHILAGFERGADEFIIKPDWKEHISLERGVVSDLEIPETTQDTAFNELLLRIQVLLRLRDMQESLRQEHQRLSRAHRAMKKQLNEVWDIQQSFLTTTFPHHSEMEITARYQPSSQVGGDYYDVIPLDRDHWGFVIADIAGHGASAAVVMALTQMTVKEFAPGILNPGFALGIFNKKLNYHLASEHFVTMFYGILNLQSMEMTYTSAGHAPPLYFNAKTQEVETLKSEPAFPLRTFDNIHYDEQKKVLNRDDKILFYTDGVIDLQNSYDRFYGVERLKEVFSKWRHSSSEAIAQAVIEDTEWFRGSRERHDDFTLMVAGRK